MVTYTDEIFISTGLLAGRFRASEVLLFSSTASFRKAKVPDYGVDDQSTRSLQAAKTDLSLFPPLRLYPAVLGCIRYSGRLDECLTWC